MNAAEYTALAQEDEESYELIKLLNNEDKIGQKKIGVEKGFGTEKLIRENIYFILLGIKSEEKKLYTEAFKELNEVNKETSEIIDKDIKRSLFDVYPDKDTLTLKQQTLKQLLTSFYATNRDLSYYQGLNDVSGFLMYYFDAITALAIFSGVEKNILRDFTSLKFDVSVVPLFGAISEIIIKDRPIWEDSAGGLMFLIQYVSVSWNLTLFSHNMDKSDGNLLRVWDFLVSSTPNMILFLICAIILNEVTDITDPVDMESIQQVKNFKFTAVKIETYLKKAVNLYNSCSGDLKFCDQFNKKLHKT